MREEDRRYQGKTSEQRRELCCEPKTFHGFKLLLYFTVIAGSVDVQNLNYRVEVSKGNAHVNLNQRKTFTL